MGSLGIQYSYVDNSSQNSVGGPTRHHYLHLNTARMGRRVSDGGPYVAAYKLFIEKRNPQLTQIMSSNDVGLDVSTSSTNSVKVLLQEKKAYGGLPKSDHREWLLYKKQVIRERGCGQLMNGQ